MKSLSEMRPIERLGRILSLLETHPGGLSVGELSKLCAVSPEVILSDLRKLEDWGVPLYDPDERDISEVPGSQRHTQTKWSLLQEGETRLWPPLRFSDREADAFLSITAGVQDPVLRSAMEKAYCALRPPNQGQEMKSRSGEPALDSSSQAETICGKPGNTGPVAHKHSWSSVSASGVNTWISEENRYKVIKGLRSIYESYIIEKHVRAFEDAARLARHVKVSYRPRNVISPSATERAVLSIIVEPLCVVLENERGTWYLMGRYVGKRSQPLAGVVDGQIITLSADRADRVEILSTTFKRPSFDMESYFSPAWGISADEEPTAVRVRFYDDFNVIEKVANRAALRQEARLERESDTTYIYTDVVAGFDEFRRWLRSFGSSAEVLEPPELRLAMRRTAEALLSLYEGRGRPWDAGP